MFGKVGSNGRQQFRNQETGGVIVNTASVNSFYAAGDIAAYCAGDDFDALENYSLAPITVGDTHYIYYTGRIAGHKIGIVYERVWTPNDLYAGVGLATLPLDGFVSMDASEEEGELATRSFSFKGRELHLNMLGGPLRVELLGPSRHMIPGYSLAEADPISGTHTDVIATWSGRSDLSHLEGKPIKVRFHMRRTQLFSFHFSY